MQPARDYAARKRAHLNTQALCMAEGLQFVPLVVEAAGGWAPAARRAWKELGEQLSAGTGDPTSETAEQLLQALAVTLQRENARAVLRRQGLPDADLRILPEP